MPQVQGQGSGEEWYRYALALEASQDGFWDWDLIANQLWGSNRWRSITGVAAACSSLDAWMDRVHPQDQPRFEMELRAVRAGRAEAMDSEHRIRQSSGAWRWVQTRGRAVRDAVGRVTHLTGSITDVTACHLTDSLTGLPNRLFFVQTLEQRMEAARRSGEWNFAVLAVALDRFPSMNEMLGSAGGDQLLIDAAERLRARMPEHAVTARLTGAEFLVCLETTRGEADAVQFAAEAAELLREAFVWCGHRILPQPALGLAQADEQYGYPEELIRDAESALAHARRQEPRGVVCYLRGMRERALEKLQLEAELEQAIRREELVMFYQPEVELRTRRIIGFEALARWRHPQRGLLPPAEFIPLAEESGLILPLGEWAMREACRQMMAWRRSEHAALREARVSVNLSAKHFEQPGLVEYVRQVLGETGLAPRRLRLEVTESSLIADAESAEATMQELHRLGVGLHMDDFGVGYHSLHHLQHLPFDTVKIDRSFVEGVARDRASRQIVGAILELARSLGMDAVAEGIESTKQLEELRKLGCPSGQGYYFGRAMAPRMIEGSLRSGEWQAREAALALA